MQEGYRRTSKRRATALGDSIEKFAVSIEKNKELIRGIRTKGQRNHSYMSEEDINQSSSPRHNTCVKDTEKCSRTFMNMAVAVLMRT